MKGIGKHRGELCNSNQEGALCALDEDPVFCLKIQMGACRMDSPEGRIFSSWKEIARFLGKGVRTVQRWEKTMGLPVRRPNGMSSNVVVASESDLRRWMCSGQEPSVKGQGRTDSDALRDLEAKLKRLEETHRRLEQALARIESRFSQIESSTPARSNASGLIRHDERRKKGGNGDGISRDFDDPKLDTPDGEDGDGRV